MYVVGHIWHITSCCPSLLLWGIWNRHWILFPGENYLSSPPTPHPPSNVDSVIRIEACFTEQCIKQDNNSLWPYYVLSCPSVWGCWFVCADEGGGGLKKRFSRKRGGFKLLIRYSSFFIHLFFQDGFLREHTSDLASFVTHTSFRNVFLQWGLFEDSV